MAVLLPRTVYGLLAAQKSFVPAKVSVEKSLSWKSGAASVSLLLVAWQLETVGLAEPCAERNEAHVAVSVHVFSAKSVADEAQSICSAAGDAEYMESAPASDARLLIKCVL